MSLSVFGEFLFRFWGILFLISGISIIRYTYYIQQDEQKRRAAMHIDRKPGEQIEVDWAGDPASIIDPDTGEVIKAWLFVGVLSYMCSV